MGLDKTLTRVLTIAGSDSGGGAGIQADLKTFMALGCYGTSVVTALTAQNTLGVSATFPVPASFVQQQLDAVLNDMGTQAVKTGMLHNVQVIETVAATLRHKDIPHVVIDPVMVSGSGSSLIQPDAVEALCRVAFPVATLLTPNLPEAETLLQCTLSTQTDMEKAACDLLQFGSQAVLLKGGHSRDWVAHDCLAYKDEGMVKVRWMAGKKVATRNTHGTGCTLSAAIAAYLAQRETLIQAIEKAKVYLEKALAQGASYRVGEGPGPLMHGVQCGERHLNNLRFSDAGDDRQR